MTKPIFGEYVDVAMDPNRELAKDDVWERAVTIHCPPGTPFFKGLDVDGDTRFVAADLRINGIISVSVGHPVVHAALRHFVRDDFRIRAKSVTLYMKCATPEPVRARIRGRFGRFDEPGKLSMYAVLYPVSGSPRIAPGEVVAFSTTPLVGTTVTVVDGAVMVEESGEPEGRLFVAGSDPHPWRMKGHLEIRDTNGALCPNVEVVSVEREDTGPKGPRRGWVEREVVAHLRNTGTEPVSANPVLFFGEVERPSRTSG